MNNKILDLPFDLSNLDPEQVRLIKSLNVALLQAMSTEDESEFFEASSELMRMCASVMKQSDYSKTLAPKHKNAFTTQAIEYSVENLNDFLSDSKVVTYDN